MDESLPQVLCMSCATNIINSFLFQKLCQYSNDKWDEILGRFEDTLSQADAVSPMAQTVYFVMNEQQSIIYTSRKRHQVKDKDAALKKVKSIIKSRDNYFKIKTEKVNVMCDECGIKFDSNFLLSKHMKSHKSSRHPCKQCGKVFLTQVQMQEHIERVHYEKTIKCTKCDKMFSTEKILKQHDKLHHVAAMCKLCFIQFPSKNALRSHIDKHDVHKCPKCSKSYLNKWTYKFHLKICGKNSKHNPAFFCDICNKGYARKNGLRTHLKTDHGFGKVHSCEWCGKKFDAISRLKYHIVKHTRERNYHCDICGGKFVTPAALVYHTRLHTGEKPFPCDLCNESFLSASRRMEHKHRKHFGPSRECHVCHAKFITGHQLRKHIQRHFNPQSKLYVPNAEVPQEFRTIEIIDD